jgi:hypothetical protein
MKITDIITESWSQKYKNSINCSHPKGFSQRAHCAGKKKHNESVKMEMVCEDCGMCQTHGNLNEIKKGEKDSNGYTRCWPGKHAEGTKKGKNGGQVRNCVPNESIEESEGKRCMQCGMINCKCPGDSCKCKPIKGWEPGKGFRKAMDEAANAAQQAAIAINMKKHHKKPKHVDESTELAEEFDLIESIIDQLAEQNGVDAEEIWEDLETLSEDELYVFAVTSEPIMESQGVSESEAWQKANNRDKTDGMSRKAVNTYRREHPGSKLQTAVTTKPSKLKKGSKASKRRKSYCSRSRGQMKMHSISCSKTPDKAICKARRRWNC